MTRHLYTIKATAREITIVLDALSRALAEADGDVFIANNNAQTHPGDSLFETFLRLATSYKTSVEEGRNVFFKLFCDAQDEEGHYPPYPYKDEDEDLQEAM